MLALGYAVAGFERILRVNMTGTFLTAKHAARIMIKNGVQGSIVMIVSMSGNIANRVCIAFLLPEPTMEMLYGTY
jgi:NAD(P)-dependent dehydrogenase (short-subunit alcohol dehydrogenase family)